MALHSSTLAWKIPMDGGAWWAAIHGVAKSQAWLSDFTFTFHFHALEKEMATHSSALAWKIPGMGEPGGLPSMGSHRFGHDWSDLAAVAADCKLLLSMYHVCCICLVKNPPAMQETWVWSLGWEDPLEKGKATHSGILAWRIPWTVWSMGLQSKTRLSDLHFTSLHHYNTQQGVWLSNVSAYMDAWFNS